MENVEKGLSRRSFLKSGLAAGIVVAGTNLAGCAPKTDQKGNANTPTSNTSDKALETSELMPSSEQFAGLEPPAGEVAFIADPIAPEDIAETVEADVVVCGAGWSGCCAAASAAEGGAKVVLLQKGSTPTCNGGEIASFGDKVHEYYNDILDPEEYITDLMYTGSWRVDENVVRRFVNRSGEAVDWLMGIVGDKIEYPQLSISKTTRRGGLNWYSSAVNFNAGGGVAAMAPMLIEYMESLGKSEVRYNTPACQLVQNDEGRITGVIAKTPNGQYVQFNASRGVVLATGGYEFNWSRLKKCLRPRDLQVRAWVNGCFGNTGDGHEMGLAAGGFEDEYPHALCTDPSGTKSGGAFGAAIHPFLRVNDYGLRFVNEAIPSNFLANAINAQVGAHDWVIADANIATNIDKIRDLTIPGVTPEQEAEGFIADSVTSDTLEGLADQMGVDPVAFVASVNRYNELCEKGLDEDFHAPAEKLAAVVTPPFYACDEGQINLSTQSGLRVNSDSAVLSHETNAPIPGLFAVGTCSGSMFYGTYPHHCSGASLGRGLTYGMIAGRILSGAEEPLN